MNNALLRYIPKEYKKEVKSIERCPGMVYNENTGKYNTMIAVTWKDGQENCYQNATYMYNLLKDFGRS